MYANARVEARDHDFESRRRGCIAIVQVVRYDADVLAKVPHIPMVAAKNSYPGIFGNDWVEFAIDRLQ